MTALRFIETLALLAVALLAMLRSRPATAPYGRRMAWIGLLLALELGVLAAYVASHASTGWGVALATQALRTLLLFSAAGAWFGLIRQEVRGGWRWTLAACVLAIGSGAGSIAGQGAIVLAFVLWRMKWIEEVGGWRRALALLLSAALLLALSFVPVAEVAHAVGGATRFEFSPAVRVWPPLLVHGEWPSATAAQLSLMSPFDRAVQALTDILRVQLLVTVFKLVFLPIRLAGMDLKRRFAINNVLVRTIPGVIGGLTLAGIVYLGVGYLRLERVRADFENTLARASTVAGVLSEDPAVLRGAPDAARLAAVTRWMGTDGPATQVRWIARGEAMAASTADSLFSSGLVRVGDSLALIARCTGPSGATVEVRATVDSSYLAHLVRPIGADLVLRDRPGLSISSYGVHVRPESVLTTRAASVATFSGGGRTARDRRWYHGRSYLPIGDWTRAARGSSHGVAELELTTTLPGLLQSQIRSLGGLAPYLGVLFVFGVLFSIAESIAVRSGRSIMQSVLNEAATLRTAAERFGAGDLEYRLPVRGKDEFGVVAASFNQMAANLKRQQEELLEAGRVEEDLAVARKIQLRFLPQRAPELGGFDVAGTSVPSREVGGDLYDWFPHADGTLGVMLGDVAGKSVPAAMLMSNVLASLRARDEMRIDLAETLSRVNRFIVEQTEPGRFVTLFYAEANAAEGTLRYANAGHNPPLLVRADGRLEWLREGGVPLGILREVTYSATTIEFVPGDTLIVYSDGITEAEAAARAPQGGSPEALPLYGEERLAEVAQAHRGSPARALLDALMQSVQTFTRGAAQADDITVAIVRRLPGQMGNRS